MEQNYSIKIKKNSTEYHKSKNPDYLHKNNSNISIQHRSNLRNQHYLHINLNEKEDNKSSYMLSPVYQTLRPENSIDNIYYKSHLTSNIINTKIEEEKPLLRQNTSLSLKTQTSFNGRSGNNYSNNYNNISSGIIDFKKNKLNNNYNNYKENNNLPYNKNSINSNNKKRSNKTILTDSNNYNFYSNNFSPKISPETNILKTSVNQDPYTNIKNNNKYFTYKNKIKTVTFLKSDSEKLDEKKNNFQKKYTNSSSKININNTDNLTNNIGKQYIDNSNNKRFIKLKYNTDKNIANDKDLKSLNYVEKTNSKNFNNTFFYRIEKKSSSNKGTISKNEEKTNKNLNASFRVMKKEEESHNSNISSITERRHLTYLNPTTKPKYTGLFIHRLLNILKKIIYMRIQKYWRIFKMTRLAKQKSYSNYRLSIGKMAKYGKYQISPSRDNKIQINSTLDNEINYITRPRFKKRIHEDSHNVLSNNIDFKKTQKISKEILKGNLDIKNINTEIKDKEEIKRKYSAKPPNKKLSQSTRTNNLIIENQLLNNKLKILSLKYLINKKIYCIESILKNALHKFNKNVICLNEKDIKNNSIYKIISIIKNYENTILRKCLFKLYYYAKISFYEENETFYKNKQNNLILKEKLIKLFYKREKKELSIIKKCFDKLYLHSILKKEIDKKSNIIENGNINININNINYEFKNRKKKLKLIVKKAINYNNIILRNIIKQWILRTKLINLKIMIVREENIKKMINPIENLLKNKKIRNENKIIMNNDLKRDNLIEGIKKLNNIFISYPKSDKSQNENGIKNSLKNEEKNMNSIINNNNANTIKRDDLIYKIYGEKLKYKIKDDWIIEEKEEEENGENASFKNDNEQKIENSLNNINDYNNRSTIENNNENAQTDENSSDTKNIS